MTTYWIGGLLAIIPAAIIANVAHAQGSNIGKNEFLRSCASCHGALGKGDGDVAKALIKRPPDLRRLSQSNDGVFPFSRVHAAIDGRIDVIAHGAREMPVWGDVYTREWNTGLPPALASKEIAEAVMRVRILALIEYIAAVQGK